MARTRIQLGYILPYCICHSKRRGWTFVPYIFCPVLPRRWICVVILSPVDLTNVNVYGWRKAPHSCPLHEVQQARHLQKPQTHRKGLGGWDSYSMLQCSFRNCIVGFLCSFTPFSSFFLFWGGWKYLNCFWFKASRLKWGDSQNGRKTWVGAWLPCSLDHASMLHDFTIFWRCDYTSHLLVGVFTNFEVSELMFPVFR